MEYKTELSLNEIQQGSFQNLLKVKEIFDKNSWKYYLTYGTLIGCIRHRGFIPWDDDVDIWVPRPDYEKFVNYCIEHKEELYPYELIHYRTNNKYIYPIARFSDSRYKNDYTNAKEYGLGLFIDIYPLDGYCEHDVILNTKIRHLKKLICLCGSKKMIKGNSKIKNILKIPYYSIVKNRNLNKLLEKIDKLAQKYSYEDSEIVECTCWAQKMYGYNKSLLKEDTELFKEFNGIEFRVPIGYDKILKKIYHNYMELPPEEERIAHHFYTITKK